MKFKHNSLIFISGLVWLAIGMLLLILGVRFLGKTILNPSLIMVQGKYSITASLEPWIANQTSRVAMIVAAALLLGHFKGKMALAKSVRRQIERIQSLPNPASLKYLYSKGYYLLIAVMMGMGFLLRIFPITLDTRGAIDVVIGSALVNGALLFFRSLLHSAYLKKRKV